MTEQDMNRVLAQSPRISQLRFWPMWIVLSIQIAALIFTVTPSFNNASRFYVMMAGPLVCVVLAMLWLLLASRLSWKEKLLSLVAALVPALLATRLIDSSMGVAVWIYGVPAMLAVLFLIHYTAQSWSMRQRQMLLYGAMILLCSLMLLFRLDGFDGAYYPELSFRWLPKGEERRTFQQPKLPIDASDSTHKTTISWDEVTAEWPGFRGPFANGTAITTSASLDWQASPPRELWRISVGPSWSSFVHAAGRLFTQEQRGQRELVTCYEAETGRLLWEHAVENRFEDVVAGAGPRATPAFSNGQLYTFGAKAVLCAIEAADGQELWRRDLMQEFNARLPVWGFSNSPLVVEDLVIVYAGGDEPHGLCAFDRTTGESVWQIESRGMNFSSAQLVELDGEQLVLFGDSNGLMAIEVETGTIAWSFKPSKWEGPAKVQPQKIGDESLIVPLGDGVGIARLEITRDGEQWVIEESWTSRKLRPSFNDFVVHEGFVYGFDQHILACVDVSTGERRWKRGRYGFGQLLLIPEHDQLIVLSEKGDLVLLAANSKRLQELGQVHAIEGKTWNHHILVDDRLFVRNGAEAACFQLNQGQPVVKQAKSLELIQAPTN